MRYMFSFLIIFFVAVNVSPLGDELFLRVLSIVGAMITAAAATAFEISEDE